MPASKDSYGYENRRIPHVELRRRCDYAVLDVPKAAQAKLGKKRFVESLKTDSAAVAARSVRLASHRLANPNRRGARP